MTFGHSPPDPNPTQSQIPVLQYHSYNPTRSIKGYKKRTYHTHPSFRSQVATSLCHESLSFPLRCFSVHRLSLYVLHEVCGTGCFEGIWYFDKEKQGWLYPVSRTCTYVVVGRWVGTIYTTSTPLDCVDRLCMNHAYVRFYLCMYFVYCTDSWMERMLLAAG